MSKSKSTGFYMRVVHRYLGFFLAGIMTVYAISGVILIFRETEFLKVEKKVEKKLQPNTEINKIGRALRIRDFKITKTEGDLVYFNNGTYNKETGLVNYTSKEFPYILEKFVHLHKATTKQPLFYLNVFFGVSLFFFSISAFWMFLPKTKVFKKGLYYTLGGIILTIVMLFL
ncbi:hypothetical protein [Lutibacter citreus]|uniref:hypothetical protein n=1 Tax=Lutibacter citreus TaxID=2138210 RepID=UPI000DBE0C04|nr:hypothetical protein [Lutibacter citreus]